MNNAKNEGSDASRLALALLKGTAVGIGAAAVLMPILALAAYSSPNPSKLPSIWDMQRSRLPRRYPGSPPQNSPEAKCCPARYRRRDCPCLFSPFLILTIDGGSETSAAVSAAFHFGAVLFGALSAAAAGKRKPKKRAKHSSPKKAPRRRSR